MKNIIPGLVDSELCKNILDEIKGETLPLIIWGGGSMSASVRKLLKCEKVNISACWIDGCESNEIIDGIPVLDIEEIRKKYNKINVDFGHSRYELADKICDEYLFIKKCFCLVNVCYGQWKRLYYDFVKEHMDEYLKSYELLTDQKSRECFTAYLNCKLSENYRYLLKYCDEQVSYFSNPFYQVSRSESYVDIGAYNGDTIREFLSVVNGDGYDQIFAIEPEDNSFDELSRYTREKRFDRIRLFKCGCWERNTTLRFDEGKESSGINSEGTTELPVYKLDTLLDGCRVTLIKINFLKGVYETLLGAEEILRNQRPKLAITVGFDEWGIMNIPRLIKKINPHYKIYLRYAAAMPARLILFAC